MTRQSPLAASCLGAALSCVAPASAQALIEQPSATDVALAYPASALRDGVNGTATVACVIALNGLLDDCNIVAENPLGQEFGAAALSIMRHFRYAPTSESGERSAGMHKRLVVRFTVPNAEPAAPNASAPASHDPPP